MSGMVVRPGDTVIVQVAEHHDLEEVTERLREKLAEALPGCRFLFVSGVEVMAAYRPEDGADA